MEYFRALECVWGGKVEEYLVNFASSLLDLDVGEYFMVKGGLRHDSMVSHCWFNLFLVDKAEPNERYYF